MYILLFINSILHAFFALMSSFDDWLIQNWTSKIAITAISQYAAIKMMELRLNPTRHEYLIRSNTHPRSIIIMIEYHSAVQTTPLYLVIFVIFVNRTLLAYRTRLAGKTAVRYPFDRHASSLSRRSEKYWKISCWTWLGWMLSSYLRREASLRETAWLVEATRVSRRSAPKTCCPRSNVWLIFA